MFGNDRNNQMAPAVDDQSVMPSNGQQQYVDNGIAPANDQAMQQSVDNLMSQGAPQMDPVMPQQNSYQTQNQQQPVNDYQVPVMVNAAPAMPASPALTIGSDDLTGIKQQALQQLSPIIDHLDQSPEEKFHITMMMLQATDDQNLVRSAYEAAKSIVDEKKRAKALLDVVNEITYFTQHKQGE